MSVHALCRSGLSRPLLLLAVVYGVLGVWVHAGRSWHGDEVGSYLAFRDDYAQLLTRFGGWQTMNFYLAGLKAIHDVRGGANWLLVLPGLAAGMLLVCLVAGIARALGGSRSTAVIAALLTAVNPFLLKYGVTIRSYIFLAAFSAAMVWALLRWKETGGWRDGTLCGVSGGFALLAHLNALYTYVAVATLAIIWTLLRLRNRDEGALRRVGRLLLPVAGVGAAVAVLYIPQLPDIERFREKWSDTPPIALAFLSSMVSHFFGANYLVLPSLLLLSFGAWHACRERHEMAWIIVLVMVPIAAISLAGVSHYPWAYSRFLIAILPWLIVLIAYGCASVARTSIVAGCGVVLVLVASSLVGVASTRHAMHAIPWNGVARYLRDQVAAGANCAVFGSPFSSIALDVYGVHCGSNVATVLRALPSDRTSQLALVVFREPPIALPTQTFGSVRVVTVRGSPASIGLDLRLALATGAGGRVNGELSETYGQIADLTRWLDLAADATSYDVLRERSAAKGRRVRNQPNQFKEATARHSNAGGREASGD